MVQEMDQETIEGAMGGASNGSGIYRKIYVWCKRWIKAIDRAMDGASNGSGSTRRSDGWSEQWIMEH